MYTNPNSAKRNQNGSLAALLPLFIVVALLGIGAFGMDVSHNVTVRSELQNATDAAALAGAQALVNPNTERDAFSDAINVAASNTADGQRVSNTSQTVSVMPTQETWDTSTNSNTFTVTASKQINNIFAKLFQRDTETVITSSKARAWRSVVGVDRDVLFPLAVSIDTRAGHNGVPLYKSKIGDIVTFDINSQEYKNAAFTTLSLPATNASDLTAFIDANLGLIAKNGGIPGMMIGDALNLTNGIAQQKQLAKGEYIKALTDPDRTLIIPVMSGEAPYTGARKLVGFIAIKVREVKINGSGGYVEVIHAELVKKDMVKGTGGIPTGTGNPEIDGGILNVSPGTVKLDS